MQTYVISYETNYGLSVIIINTDKGENHAKELALKKGAWDTLEIEKLNTSVEGCVFHENTRSG